MTTETTKREHPHRMLRIFADDYYRYQRGRVAKGEQIRQMCLGRDHEDQPEFLESLGFVPLIRDGKVKKSAADLLLEAILKGDCDEPHKYLADSYRADWERERRAFDEMKEELPTHPAWGWLGKVRGIGPALGGKLLSRLDIDMANNASSFWLYCGLGTVPGQRWKCPDCGRVMIFPESHNVTGNHTIPGSKRECKHLAVKVQGSEDGIRAAQPKPRRGEKSPYDERAKDIMYLAGMAFLKAGAKSFYGDVYRKKVTYYERERPGWDKGRRHYSALRAAEKLMLSHLYEAWSLAIGKDPGQCYAEAELGHADIIRAADVLAWEAAAK